MDQIYKFNEFILILESEKIDEKLFDDLKKVMYKDLFKRLTSCPNFGGFYTKPIKLYPNSPVLKEIFYKMNGIEKKIDGIYYDGNGGFFRRGDLWREYDEKKRIKHINILLNEEIFLSISQDITYSCGKPFFNPFTNNIEDLPLIKKLKDVGMEIVSNNPEKSKGILVLRFKERDRDYVIEPSGEIYYRIHRNGYISPFFDDRRESLKAINNLKDLIRKIICVYISNLKKMIEYNKFDLRIPEELILALKTKEMFNNPIYVREYNKIIKKYPKMALYLLEPDNPENKELIKGVRLLGRSEIID